MMYSSIYGVYAQCFLRSAATFNIPVEGAMILFSSQYFNGFILVEACIHAF